MAIKKFNIAWIGVYKASSNSYVGGSAIQVGGSSGYNSYIGIPTAVRDAIKTSKTTPKLTFHMNVTDGGEFDVGAHKETSNKAGGTMPYYNYIGLHPIFGTGWKEIDLTSDFMPEYRSGTRQGIVLYGASSNYGSAHGNTNNSNEAYFEVEGTWNTAPEAPTLLEPTSSTVADTSLLVKWNASQDDEQASSALKYGVSFYDGTKWLSEVQTATNVLTYTFNTSSYPETSGARVRVRAYDGELWGAYAYSPYFSIRHNRPPSKPTQLTPDGGEVVDRTSSLRMTWKHNDDGVQAGFQLAWRTVSSSGATGAWNYVPSSTTFRSTTNQYYDVPANTFPASEIEWGVKTKDQQGLESTYSTYQRFIAGQPTNAPTILKPVSGSTIPNSNVTVEWSSVDQDEYEVELWDSSFSTLLKKHSGLGAVKALTVDYALSNSTTYLVRVRILSREVGLWSPWSTTTFTTAFQPPAKPTVSAEADDDNGNIVILWTAGTGSVTPTAYTQVLRREYSSFEEQEWKLVADNEGATDTFIDYTPASDLTYEYMVRAWGANNTSVDSDIVEIEVQFDNAYLHRASTPSDVLFINSTDSRSQDIEIEGELMFFRNRKSPVYEYGINELNVVDLTFTVYSPDDLRLVLRYLRLKETFLYRDGYGRRIYCVPSKPKIKDLDIRGFEISVTLSEVDYDER